MGYLQLEGSLVLFFLKCYSLLNSLLESSSFVSFRSMVHILFTVSLFYTSISFRFLFINRSKFPLIPKSMNIMLRIISVMLYSVTSSTFYIFL